MRSGRSEVDGREDHQVIVAGFYRETLDFLRALSRQMSTKMMSAKLRYCPETPNQPPKRMRKLPQDEHVDIVIVGAVGSCQVQ